MDKTYIRLLSWYFFIFPVFIFYFYLTFHKGLTLKSTVIALKWRMASNILKWKREREGRGGSQSLFIRIQLAQVPFEIKRTQTSLCDNIQPIFQHVCQREHFNSPQSSQTSWRIVESLYKANERERLKKPITQTKTTLWYFCIIVHFDFSFVACTMRWISIGVVYVAFWCYCCCCCCCCYCWCCERAAFVQLNNIIPRSSYYLL